MDKLSVMRAFCRIVDRGSFVRAAEDLGVSAALLSTEVRMLEKSLGTGLLNRTTLPSAPICGAVMAKICGGGSS